MIILDAGPALSDISLIDRISFVRDELADNVVISAVIAMLIAETWRHIMITTQWLENLVKRNISNYEERVRAEGLDQGRAEGLDQGLDQGRAEGLDQGLDQGRAEGRDQGRDQILSLLDENTRKDVERKLRDNHHPENRRDSP